MARFNSGNCGKPKGTKEHSWARVSYWIARLNAEWDKLTPNQRAHYSCELTKLLVSKLKSLPGTPNDSVLNADASLKSLHELEGIKPIPPVVGTVERP